MRDDLDAGGYYEQARAIDKLMRDAGYVLKVSVNGKPVVVTDWNEMFKEKAK